MSHELTCLLVDDDPDDQEIFAMAVEAAGSTITCHYADDGIKALEMLSNDHFVPEVWTESKYFFGCRFHSSRFRSRD